MGGGGGSSDATVYTNLIPTYIPGMTGMATTYLSNAVTLFVNNNFQAYSDPTYATQNANELAGIAALAARGAGDTLEYDGETYLISVLTDGFIGINPRLDAALQAKLDEIIESLNDQALPSILDAHVFAFGSSEHNIEEAKAAKKIMDAINTLGEKIYYDDFRMERRIQDAALSHAVPYGQREIRDAETTRGAGVYAREYLQGEYTDNWKKWNEDMVIPVRNLDVLGNAIRSILGTVRNATTSYYKPPAMNEIAGLALTGLGIYSMWNKTTMSIYKNPAGNKYTDRPQLPDAQRLDAFDLFEPDTVKNTIAGAQRNPQITYTPQENAPQPEVNVPESPFMGDVS